MSDKIRSKFKKVIESDELANLSELMKDLKLRQLPAVEREQLASLAVDQGVKRLKKLSSPCEDERTGMYFALASKLSPLNGRIYLRQAQAYYHCATQDKKGNIDSTYLMKALDLAQQASNCDSADASTSLFLVEVLSKLGNKLSGQGYFAQMKSLLDQIDLENLSVTDQLHYYDLVANYSKELAKESQEPCDWQKAIEFWQKILQGGGSKSYHVQLAQAWVEIFKSVNQSACLQRALAHLQIFSDWEESDLNSMKLAASLYVEIYHNLGGVDTARLAQELFSKLVFRCKQDWKIFYEYNSFLLDLAWDQHSLPLFERVHSQLQDAPVPASEQLQWLMLSADASCGLGVLREEIGLVKSGKQILQNFFQSEEEELQVLDPHYWQIKGRIDLELGRYFEGEEELFDALQSIQRGLLKNTSHNRLWYLFARAYYCFGDLKDDPDSIRKSVGLFNQAQSVGTATYMFWFDWASALLKLSEWSGEPRWAEDALICFEKSLEMIKAIGRPMDINLLYLYGCAWDYYGELTDDDQGCVKAISILNEVVEVDPQHLEAQYALALAHMHFGQNFDDEDALVKACEIFASLVQGDHEDEFLWNEWGVCLLHYAELIFEKNASYTARAKILHQALECLQKSLQLGCAHSYYNLACVYALLNQEENALFYLEKAVSLGLHPPYTEILEDHWLDAIRFSSSFQKILDILQEADEQEEEKDFPIDDDEEDLGLSGAF